MLGTLKQGSVKDCVHPARVINAVGTHNRVQPQYDPSKMPNFLGNTTGVAVGTKSDATSYADGTSGRPVSAVNHILALKKTEVHQLHSISRTYVCILPEPLAKMGSNQVRIRCSFSPWTGT